uniref:MBG domain-containing protein n=1 Tax=Acidocella sp. C78 TaxID=1671486 RepID=UPI0035AEF398
MTPGNRTKTYGQALALGTTNFSVSGLLNNDRVTGVTLSSAGASATAAVGVSPYADSGEFAHGFRF